MKRYIIKRYWQVYKTLVFQRITKASLFRVNFLLTNLMDVVYYLMAFLSIGLIYEKLPLIAGWNREEFLFFVAFMLCIDNLAMIFSIENYWELSHAIKTGALDYVLLKPLSTTMNLFLRMTRPTCFFNIPLSFGSLIFFLDKLGIDWWIWPSVFLCIFLGYILHFLISSSISCLMFWFIEGTSINFIRMELIQVGKYPEAIYPKTIRYIFTFLLPVLVMGSIPVKVFLKKSSPWALLFLVGAILVMIPVYLLILKRALFAYESASS